MSPPRIVFATAELAPLATTGGLGDVAAALPRALAGLGHVVSVVLPFHESARKSAIALRNVATIRVPGFGEGFPVHRADLGPGEPDLYLVEHEGFFRRTPIYGDAFGDYPDNLERFAFFSRAVIETLLALDLRPDVLHANDWHTGLCGAYLRTLYRDRPSLRPMRVVFTIHNLAYQGRFERDRLRATGLPEGLLRFEWLEFHGQLNLLKAGIVFADAITTVSPGYAAEILSAEYGAGLDGVLRFRRDDLRGILNGIDVERWNPAADSHLPARYDADDLSGKAVCKRALLDEMGLALPREAPLLAMISRLVWQKGADVVLSSLSETLRLPSRAGAPGFVLLGSGDGALEQGFREAAARQSDRVAVRIGYDEPLSHRIEAGADLFLMPSRYEPCGLNQMYSLRYGTLPVVRACGGLADTVEDASADGGFGNGFVFREPTGADLQGAVVRALRVYADSEAWRRIQRRAMAEDHSWRRSAAEYAALYEELRHRPPRDWTLPA